MERAWAVALRVVGPALLGLGTIFAPKPNPDDHWSTPVNLVVAVAGGPETPGGERDRVAPAVAGRVARSPAHRVATA